MNNSFTFGVWDAFQRERGLFEGECKKCGCTPGCKALVVTWPDGEKTEVCSTRIAPVTAPHLKAEWRFRNDHYLLHGS